MTTTTRKKVSPVKEKLADDIYIVAIGASAGGLEAINSFFENVPLDSDISFILIQHLSPDYKSMMPELLTRHTKLNIGKVTDGIKVEKNNIYTIPADKNITISGGKLYLEERGNPKSLNLPTNIFLKALAEDQKKRAIAIILSGTGSDGTLGIKSIKEHGGMVIAQEPQTAAFDSMPKSVIATGLADFILPPSEMPETIIKYIKHPNFIPQEVSDNDLSISRESEIFRILNLLHKKTNLDFRQYKKATIIRRINRRMNIRNVHSRENYLKLLENDPEEVVMLSNDILIGVTGFFRDKTAFEAIDKKVLSELVKTKEEGKELRIWVAGCSTGQEVYSFAMLIKEQCRIRKKYISVKIFATDADQRAIDKASKGVYTNSIEDEVPKELLNRYFDKIEDKYYVKKEIREMAIFAKHDITRDPPFNNIDLASCRNLLIYIESSLQEKVLAYIHFSLVVKGYLFLGSSETLGEFSKTFTEIDKKHKIYQNLAVNHIIDLNRLFSTDQGRISRVRPEKQDIEYRAFSESKILGNFKDAILEDLVPPTVIINDNNDVVHVSGEVEQYLKLPKKQLSLNILKMINEELYVPLSNIISKAKSTKQKAISPPVTINNKKKKYLNIVAKPYNEPVSQTSYCILSFISLMQPQLNAEQVATSTNISMENDHHIQRLEDDLKETKEYLQSAIEELETSNEELQATNEELMAANEELQSSNEELQSVNEELYTVNNEFQDKLNEMTELNDDLNNFIQCTSIATLFLDEKLNIKRFTEIITPLIKIAKTDIGRYIGDFNHVFQSFNLIETASKVLETSSAIDHEVTTKDGHIYLLQALPYITAKKVIKGVVLSFVDVNEIKKIENALKKRTEELEHSNQELEQFAYLAAHDLKAPITNLAALVKMIDENDGINNAGNAIFFEKMKEVIALMNNTIGTLNEVITIKKNLRLDPETLNIEDELNDVLFSIDEMIISSNARIKTNFTQCENLNFPRFHLQSILQNLITNAIKYRKENVPPQLVVTSDRINEEYSRLIVKDNGRGMDMKLYGDKLFGLFQRFHLDTEGKGIGLHITKSIVEKYGGYIEVESEPDEGTTFKIYFNNNQLNNLN